MQPLLVAGHAMVAHGVDQTVGARRQHRHHAARQDLLLEQLEIELLLARAQRHQADLHPLVEVERQLGRHRLDLGIAGRGRIDGDAFDPRVVPAHDLLQVVVDVDPREGQHAIAQRELEAAQLVEPESVHDQAERRGVDEQRDQHEQGGRKRDEFADILGQALVAGRHHGEHDRDGAAQAAPHQDRLVSLVDGLHEVGLLQHRQHAEHHERARQRRRRPPRRRRPRT